MANHKLNVSAVRYSKATKINPLTLLSKGWTVNEVAKKHKTTVQSIHSWKKKYPGVANKVVLTKLGNNTGEVFAKTIKPKAKKAKKAKKSLNSVTITLNKDIIKELSSQAKADIRTIESQAKYYILNGIRNHIGIPF